MYVILDLHAAPGGQGYDAAISDYDRRNRPCGKASKTGTKWLPVEAHRRALCGRALGGGYDLLNEPNWDLPGGNALGRCTCSARTAFAWWTRTT